MHRVIILALFWFLSVVGSSSEALAKRVALIVGNSTYENTAVLPNPTNDATDLAASFSLLGYDVTLVKDASRATLLDALRDFRYESLGAEHSIVYYAGHGIEINRQNYLVPIDAELKSDIDVEYEAIPLSLLVAATSGAKDLKLVILDACRDNPFLKQMTRTVATRSMGRGLALVEPTGNSLVAYSAKEGTVALDGQGKNSPYAAAFLSALSDPELEIGQFFRHVRDAVMRTTNGQQEPFLYGSLSTKPVYFQPQKDDKSVVENNRPTALSLSPQDGVSEDTKIAVDLSFWESIRESDQSTDYRDYLESFPNGRFRSLAQRRLAALSPVQSQLETPSPVEQNSPPDLRLSRQAVRDLQARLNLLGYSAGVEDGLIGKRTLAAVRKFRNSTGMAGGSQIDQDLLDNLSEELPEARLVTHRNSLKPREEQVSGAITTSTSQSQSQNKKAARANIRNLSAFVGNTYCLKKGDKVENGAYGAISCYQILSLDQSMMRYKTVYRHDFSYLINTSTFTKSKAGNLTYGRITLPISGSSHILAPPGSSIHVLSTVRK